MLSKDASGGTPIVSVDSGAVVEYLLLALVAKSFKRCNIELCLCSVSIPLSPGGLTLSVFDTV